MLDLCIPAELFTIWIKTGFAGLSGVSDLSGFTPHNSIDKRRNAWGAQQEA